MNLSPYQIQNILPTLLEARQPVLITGRPGGGKTDMVMGVNGWDKIVFYPALCDPTDFKGYPCLIDGEAKFIAFADLAQLFSVDRKTIVFFDEIGQAAPSVQGALMNLVLARQIGGVPISGFISFAAATNRAEDKSGVGFFNEALKSRFAIYNLEPTAEDWIKWALNDPKIPIGVIGAVKNNPDLIEKWEPSKGIMNSPTPRSITKMGYIISSYNRDDRIAVASGFVGDGAAIEIIAYLDLVDGIPSYNDIVRFSGSIDVPTRPDLRYTAAISLSRAVKEGDITPVAEYVERLGAEYSVIFWRSVKQEIKDTDEFTKWAVRFGNGVLN